MKGVIYVCSISQLGVHTPIPVKSVFTEYVLRPMECFSGSLKCVVSTHDTIAFLDDTERLYVRPFTESWQTSLLLCYLWALCVVLLILRALSKTDASKCFTKRAMRVCSLKRVCTFHKLYEDKPFGTGWFWCGHSEQKQYFCNPKSSRHLRGSG